MLPVRQFVVIALLASMLAALEFRPAAAAFGISSVVGGTELLGPPPPPPGPVNILPGSHEDAMPIVFPEVLGGVVRFTILHPLGLDVDHDGSNVVAAPTISGNIVNPALIDTTIPVGTTFNSYMFHFDPVGSPFFAFYVTTINFDNPVIGVQLFSNGFALEKPSGLAYTGTLEQGDLQVALNGGPGAGYYPTGTDFRGVEEDSFVLAIAGNTVMLAGSAHGPEIDQIRILTAAPISTGVPEPATAASWALIALIGGSGAFFWQKKQKNVGG